MIDTAYIIGLAMAIVNLFKTKLPKNTVPLVAVVLTICLNILNAYIFGGSFEEAGKEAFISSGIVVGLFAASDKKRSPL